MRGQMPAFDGRRDQIAWTVITPTNGWTRAGEFAVAGGMCTLVVRALKAAWSPEIMFYLPASALPRPGVPEIEFAGRSYATGAFAPSYIDPTTGAVHCLASSTAVGGGGIAGTVTYPT